MKEVEDVSGLGKESRFGDGRHGQGGRTEPTSGRRSERTQVDEPEREVGSERHLKGSHGREGPGERVGGNGTLVDGPLSLVTFSEGLRRTGTPLVRSRGPGLRRSGRPKFSHHRKETCQLVPSTTSSTYTTPPLKTPTRSVRRNPSSVVIPVTGGYDKITVPPPSKRWLRS